MWTPGQLHVTMRLVKYVDFVEQRTLGIEPGTSCIRGPILTNWAIHATFLWPSSCSLSCPPLVPLGKRCGQGSLTIEGNPLLQKETPYYRKGTTYYRKAYRTIERKSLTIIELNRFSQKLAFRLRFWIHFLSWSYICLCMVARPPFVFKFITLSRGTFLRTIWCTTRRIVFFLFKISSQTPGNKVP